MRVLITGGAGFIGSHIADLLLENGHQVFIVDNLSTGRLENVPADAVFQDMNILNFGSMAMAFREVRPEAVIHLAAQPAISTSVENPYNDFDINVRGTMIMIDLCQSFGVARMVFSSTSAVYERSGVCREYESRLVPESPYGISKLTAEMYVRYLLPESVVLRFGNVYGPRQVPLGENQLIARIIRHFEYGDPFYIHGDGYQMRDFVYVRDVAGAVMASLSPLEGIPGVYNIASGWSRSVLEISGAFAKYYDVLGYKWEFDEDRGERQQVIMNIGRAQRFLGWEPKEPFEFGIAKTIEWWKARDKSPHQS